VTICRPLRRLHFVRAGLRTMIICSACGDERSAAVMPRASQKNSLASVGGAFEFESIWFD